VLNFQNGPFFPHFIKKNPKNPKKKKKKKKKQQQQQLSYSDP
jgi:hypothetical protein